MALLRITAFAGIVAASIMMGCWPASAGPVEGAWAIHDRSIPMARCMRASSGEFRCSGKPRFCGALRHAHNPDGADGQPKEVLSVAC
jgi:hypothetical protein